MKKLRLGLATIMLLTFIVPFVSAKSYIYTLPAYEGIDNYSIRDTYCSKLTDAPYGQDQITKITGGGSYAVQGNMINSDGVQRGAYHTCQQGQRPVLFVVTGKKNNLYYLRLRNNNSISSDATAWGSWDCDEN